MEKNNDDARTGLILSLCGLVTFGITSIIGIIYCGIGYLKSDKLKGQGKTESIVGLIISSIIIVCYLIFLANYIAKDDFETSLQDLSEIIETSKEYEKVEDNQKEEIEKSEPKEIIYNVGDVVPADDFEITIEQVSVRDKVGTEYYNIVPSEGGIYVCIDYKIKNVSDEPHSSFAFPSVKLQNSKGTKYSHDYDASVHYRYEKKDRDTKIVSDLNPGITVKDYDTFEISKELYEGDSWYVLIDSKTKVKIK